MRQAGRYLPEYRNLRDRYALKELFLTPALAAEITLMPIEQIGVDAAILFSDISVVALALGLELEFQEGPLVRPLVTPETVAHLAYAPEALQPIVETIQLLMPQLYVPLIGFCGGPFTVATYLAKGGIEGVKRWAYESPDTLDTLLGKIVEVSIAYLRRQTGAGVSVVQIFDSWANVLSKEHFQRFCLPYYQRMIQAIEVPTILFLREASLRLDLLKELPCALSLDWQTDLPLVRSQTHQTLQGNLDPALLYAPFSCIQRTAEQLRLSMQGDAAWIAGLGHGVKPDVTVEAVRVLVQALQGV